MSTMNIKAAFYFSNSWKWGYCYQVLYVKDDFFDSISCDASEREGGRTERTKFSEQRKIDTEVTGCELYNNNTGSFI